MEYHVQLMEYKMQCAQENVYKLYGTVCGCFNVIWK